MSRPSPFMSYLCDLFSIFSLIFIVINHNLIKQTCFIFVHSLFQNISYYYSVDEKSKQFSNSKSSASACCLAFAWLFASFSLALLIKVLLIKKPCSYGQIVISVTVYKFLEIYMYFVCIFMFEKLRNLLIMETSVTLLGSFI